MNENINKVKTQIESPEVPEFGTSSNQTTSNKSSKKKKFIIAGVVLVLVLAIGGTIFVKQQNTDTSNNTKNKQSSEQAKAKADDKVSDYEECLQTKNAVVEAGTCMTEDGAIYLASDKKADIPEESTVVVGDQSATLDIGPADKSNPEYLYGIGIEYSGVEVTKVLLTTSITNGAAAKTLPVRVSTKNVDIKSCNVSVKTIADKPDNKMPQYSGTASSSRDVDFVDGTHTITLKCPSVKKGESLVVEKYLRVTDGQPELCKDFKYDVPSNSPTSASALKSAMTGTWVGCVDSPWWPSYHVVVSFNQDGTYNAYSDESLDGYTFDGGFYFGHQPRSIRPGVLRQNMC